MGAEVVALQEALVALVATIGFDFGVDCQNVFGKVVLPSKLVSIYLTFKLFPFFMYCKEILKVFLFIQSMYSNVVT